MSRDNSGTTENPGHSARTTIGAAIGGLCYALSIVSWLISVPISAASRVAGIVRGSSPTMQIEYDLLGFWIIIYGVLGAVATIVLLSSLDDNNKLARIARNMFVTLFILAGIVWLLP
jgi:hypothetical protein